MGVSSLPNTVTRRHRNCNLNPGPSAPESSMLTTRLPSQVLQTVVITMQSSDNYMTKKMLQVAVV